MMQCLIFSGSRHRLIYRPSNASKVFLHELIQGNRLPCLASANARLVRSAPVLDRSKLKHVVSATMQLGFCMYAPDFPLQEFSHDAPNNTQGKGTSEIGRAV